MHHRTNSIRLHIPIVFCIPQQYFLEDSTKKSCRFSKNIFFAQVSRLRDLYLQWSTWCLSLLAISCFSQYPRFLFLGRLHFCQLLPPKILVGLIPSPFSTLTPLPEQRLLIQTQFRIIVRTRGTLYLSLYTMIWSWILLISEPMPTTIARFHLFGVDCWSRVYYRLRSRPWWQDFWVFPLSRISQLPTLRMHVLSAISVHIVGRTQRHTPPCFLLPFAAHCLDIAYPAKPKCCVHKTTKLAPHIAERCHMHGHGLLYIM